MHIPFCDLYKVDEESFEGVGTGKQVVVDVLLCGWELCPGRYFVGEEFLCLL